MLKRILVVIAAVLGILVIAVVAFIALFDWNRLREPMEDALSAATGREVRIKGDVDVDLGRVPRIAVNDLELANADWADRPNMATIDRALVSVDLLSIFGKSIRMPRIDLQAPRVFLRRRSDGTANWDFEGPAEEAAAPEERTEVPVIERLRIDGGVLAYHDEAAGIDIEADINTATGETSDEVELNGSGTIRDRPFEVSLSGGPITQLHESDEPYPIAGEVVVGDTRAALSGELRDPLGFDGLDARLELSGPNAADLYPVVGLPAPATPPYDLQGQLARDGDVWRFSDFDGRVGDSDLSGTLEADLGGERPKVTGDLHSQKLDFDDLGILVGAPSATGEGETVNPTQRQLAEQYAQRQRVLPDASLDLTRVRAIDADVRFTAAEVLVPGVPLGDVKIAVDLDNGLLALSPLEVAAAGGRLASEISVDARDTPVTTYWNLRVNGFDLGQVADGVAGSGEVMGRLQFQTVGQSIRDALATANGDASFIMNDGQLNALAIEAIGLDVLESLAVLTVGEEEEPTPVPMRCAVAAFALVDGAMEMRAFIIDTTDSVITADGRIDFNTEQFELEMLAHPKDISLFSVRSPITVSGTFRSVDVGVSPDELGVRAAAAAVLGTLLTPVAAAIAFIEPGLAEDAPCQQLINEAGVTKGG